MKNQRKKILAILLLLVVLVLGGVSIFVATRVGQKEPVAPTAPESKPQASQGSCDTTKCVASCDSNDGTNAEITIGCTYNPTLGCVDGANKINDYCTNAMTQNGCTQDCKDLPSNYEKPVAAACTNTFTVAAVQSPVPNCGNITGPAEITLGESANYTATYYAAATGGLTDGSIFYSNTQKETNGTYTDKKDVLDFFYPPLNTTGLTRAVTNNGTKTITFTPTAVGKYWLRCRAWNDGISECQPPAVAAVSRQTNDKVADCIGKVAGAADYQMEVTVVAPGTTELSCVNNTSKDEVGTSVITTVGNNQTITYEITAKNSGTATAPNVFVKQTLDTTKMTFVDSASACTFDATTKIVSCKTSLAADETKKLTFRVKTVAALTEAEKIAVKASVKDNETATTTGSECTNTLTAALPVLTANKKAYKDNVNNNAGDYSFTDPIESVAKNQTFTYAVEIKNSGTGMANGIVLNDPLTGQFQDILSFVDADNRCTWTASSRDLVCTVDLKPNETTTIGFRATVGSGAVNGSIIKNIGEVKHQSQTISVTKNLLVSTVVGCEHTCTSDAECQTGYTCDTTLSKCRNTLCIAETSCVCPSSVVVTPTPTVLLTATPAPTSTLSPTIAVIPSEITPTQSPETLPETGIFDIPGAAIFGGGLILAVVGILLAL